VTGLFVDSSSGNKSMDTHALERCETVSVHRDPAALARTEMTTPQMGRGGRRHASQGKP